MPAERRNQPRILMYCRWLELSSINQSPMLYKTLPSKRQWKVQYENVWLINTAPMTWRLTRLTPRHLCYPRLNFYKPALKNGQENKMDQYGNGSGNVRVSRRKDGWQSRAIEEEMLRYSSHPIDMTGKKKNSKVHITFTSLERSIPTISRSFAAKRRVGIIEAVYYHCSPTHTVYNGDNSESSPNVPAPVRKRYQTTVNYRLWPLVYKYRDMMMSSHLRCKKSEK